MALLNKKPKADEPAAEAAPVKKGGIKPKAAPAPDPDPETGTAEVTEEVEVEIDIDALDDAGVEDLVKSENLVTPKTWKKFDLAAKKEWLNDQFTPAETEEATEEEEEEEVEEVKEAPAPTPVAKAAKGKTKATATDDFIVATAHQIENLSEADAKKMVAELNELSEVNFFRLGGVISVIQANGWFAPFGSLKEFIEGEHGINYRRAMYWVTIYNGLIASEVPWSKVSDIGWTKLKEIVPVLTLKNLDKMVKLAKANTVLQLNAIVKGMTDAANKGDAGGGEDDGEAQEVSTMTFKVHADQKATVKAAIAKAKDMAKTTVDTVALEFICLDFNGGADSVAKILAKLTLEQALEAFSEAFPNASLTYDDSVA